MTNEEFDNLWQEAEARGAAHRLALEYPAWVRRKRHIRNSVVAGVFVCVMAATTLPMIISSTSNDYITVCCNRTDTDDAQWVALAAEMLTIEMI